MGISALRKIQYGVETTKGSAVTATTVLLGELTMKDVPTFHRPNEERGDMAKYHRSTKVGNMAEMTFNADATYEQIIYPMLIGVEGSTTAIGTTTSKSWIFTPAMTAAGTYKSLTLEYGDNVQAYETEFCMARRIEISGAMNEPVKITVDMFGRKMTSTAFTATPTTPTVESIITQMGKLYLDAETGTVGSNEVAATLITFTYTIETGLTPIRYGNGSLDFSNYIEQQKHAELKMTLAFNAGVVTERANFDGTTKRLARLQLTGSAISGGGTKTLNLDICGLWTAWDTLSEREGEDVVDVTLSAERGTTYTKLFEVSVINAVAAIT